MQHHLSPECRRAVCSVLGLPPKSKNNAKSITDIAVVLYLVLVLTRKPKDDYPEHPEARRYYELQCAVGPARTGERCGRGSMGAANRELEALGLIERGRVFNAQGANLGPDTPCWYKLHPENGAAAEVSDEVLAFIVAAIRDRKFKSNRKSQAIRFAVGTGLRFEGEMADYESRLGLTREAVKDFFAEVEAFGYARVRRDAPVAGRRGRWLYGLELCVPGAAVAPPATVALPAMPAPPAVAPPPDAKTATSEPSASAAPPAPTKPAPIATPTPALASPVFPAMPAPVFSDDDMMEAPVTSAPKVSAAGAGKQTSAAPDVLRFEPMATLEDLMADLWLPYHMAEILHLAKQQAGELDDVTIADRFVKPVVDLQQTSSDKHALQWALEQALTAATGPLYGDNTARRFPGYIRSVFAAHRGQGGPPPKDHSALRAVAERWRQAEEQSAAAYRNAEHDEWVSNVDALLAKAAELGASHPGTIKDAPRHIHQLAQATMAAASANGEDASRAYHVTRAKLEAAVAAGITTWAQAARLQVKTNQPPPEPERREPTRDELKSLGARAYSVAALTNSAAATESPLPARNAARKLAEEAEPKASAAARLTAPRPDGEGGVMVSGGRL